MDIEESLGVESDLQRRRSIVKARATQGNNDDAQEVQVPTTTTFRWQSITAGYVAGMCGVLVGHPLDSIKVWTQMGGTATSKTATTTTLSSKWRHLYAGVQGPLLTVGLVQALNFGVYDAVRRHLYDMRVIKSSGEQPQTSFTTSKSNNNADDHNSRHGALLDVAIAASVAGAVISVPTSVLQATKIHQQVHKVFQLRAAAVALYQQGGARAFFAGYTPHLYCETCGRGVYFFLYEYFKRCMIDVQQDTNNHKTELSLPQRMLCAGLSNTVAWLLIFPADVLRCRLYASSSDAKKLSTFAMAKQIFHQSGLRPFYRGLGVTILRAAPVSAAVLPIYDQAHAWLTKSAL